MTDENNLILNQDELREVSGATFTSLNLVALDEFIEKAKADAPELVGLDKDLVYEALGITRNGNITLMAVLLFCLSPQVYFPDLYIDLEMLSFENKMSLETQIKKTKAEGTIFQMIEGAIGFVKANTPYMISIDPKTGERQEISRHSIPKLRKDIINAFINRDYSQDGENEPIQMLITDYDVIINYPMSQNDSLPDRNMMLASAMEILGYR